MKARFLILPILCLAASAQGAVTLQFSSTTEYLGNFLNGAGTAIGAGAKMVWGIVVDADRNGFAGGVNPANPYMDGFSLAANANGIALSTLTGGASDDVLFLPAPVMVSNLAAKDGAAIGENRVLAFTNLLYSGGVGNGDQFAIIWFDQLALGGTAATGLKYGVYNPPSNPPSNPLWFGAANVLPTDSGNYSFCPAFAGPDAPKTMDFQLGVAVPEASTALLGALGALGLLRRRR